MQESTTLDRELRRMAVLHARELAAMRRTRPQARRARVQRVIAGRLPNTAVPTRTIVAP